MKKFSFLSFHISFLHIQKLKKKPDTTPKRIEKIFWFEKLKKTVDAKIFINIVIEETIKNLIMPFIK